MMDHAGMRWWLLVGATAAVSACSPAAGQNNRSSSTSSTATTQEAAANANAAEGQPPTNTSNAATANGTSAGSSGPAGAVGQVSGGGTPTGSVATASGPPGNGTTSPAPSTVQTLALNLAKALRGSSNFMFGLFDVSAPNWIQEGLNVDLYYAYLDGYGDAGWAGYNPDGTYIDITAAAAASNGATPMYTYYQLGLEMQNKNYGVFTSPSMHQYLLDVKLLYQHLATFNKPAVVHFEPDFFGFLVQYTTANNTTADAMAATLQYSDFHDCDALPQTVHGMLQCLVLMGRTLAPQVKIGFSSSVWAYSYDDTDPNINVAPYAQKMANFLLSVSADQTDFIVVETLDRDAGFYESSGTSGVYWDATNQTLPNFTNALAWVAALTKGLNKPALWWQTPLGAPSPSFGSTGHWRDNRVAYFTTHIPDLIAAGGAGVAFGGGEPGMTDVDTDGGQFKNAWAAYKAKPVALGP